MSKQEKFKPILCLDFDGVIHSYESSWQGAANIPDPPVEGAMEFLAEATLSFEVNIFSSRSHQEGGIRAMQDWMRLHMTDVVPEYETVLARLHWPTVKPPALLTIDDRAIQFTGAWPSMDFIRNFKPWNKQ